MSRYRKNIGSAGDTIVEVLIVLAVLSLAFTTSYTIATKALGQARNAEEHSEALGILNTQVEWLRAAIAKPINPTLPTNTAFCMVSPSTFTTGFDPGYDIHYTAATDKFSQYPTTPAPATCTSANGFYHSLVVYSGEAAGGNFSVTVRWDGSGSLGRQQVQLNYRTHQLTN